MVEETIAAVHSAGGRAVLPGGYLPDPESLRGELDGLCAVGMDGLEVGSPNYDEETTQIARTLAEERGLLSLGLNRRQTRRSQFSVNCRYISLDRFGVQGRSSGLNARLLLMLD